MLKSTWVVTYEHWYNKLMVCSLRQIISISHAVRCHSSACRGRGRTDDMHHPKAPSGVSWAEYPHLGVRCRSVHTLRTAFGYSGSWFLHSAKTTARHLCTFWYRVYTILSYGLWVVMALFLAHRLWNQAVEAFIAGCSLSEPLAHCSTGGWVFWGDVQQNCQIFCSSRIKSSAVCFLSWCIPVCACVNVGCGSV